MIKAGCDTRSALTEQPGAEEPIKLGSLCMAVNLEEKTEIFKARYSLLYGTKTLFRPEQSI